MNDTTELDEREANRLDAIREQDQRRLERRRDALRYAMHDAHRGATWDSLVGVRRVERRVGDAWIPEDLADVLDLWYEATAGAASSLFLVGPPGVGKSYAAAVLALRAVDRENVAWWSVAGLLDALRPSRRDAAEDVWQAACSAPLLVLDDLAHTRASEWAAERMWILADVRAGNRLRTIVTTNATFPELEDVWGRATMDRFRDGIAVVRFAGESKRTPLW